MEQEKPPATPYMSAARGLAAVVGVASALQGLASASAIVALNTLGVVGLGALVVGGLCWFEGNEQDRARNTLWAMAMATGGAAFLLLVGRPLEDGEREPNLLTVLGSVYLVAVAVVLAESFGGTAKQPPRKNCPDCAHLVLKEARKCQYCGHHFSPSGPTAA